MPRNHHPGASTLRNRNRITNKTRLKIIRGNVDADDLLIPDEDEEKHRLTNLVAGVDAEDANEHHLQEVLSAAHKNNVARQKTEVPPSAYIPTPDSTGVADNYEELYPASRWKDPATFVCTSTTVEESTASGLANGFTYYMDERDKDWLDKNNEEARGEGTSAQGALSTSNTRTSARSAKAKGKEPDVSQPVVISEDEFELVMGLFEKMTHEKTEFLHHSLETGMPFPAFTEYQDIFSSPLPPTTFATYAVSSWIPNPAQLVRIARTIYPYWKERRVERAGHRIIPVLNFDESDTSNESYICFRRREIKAIRKTRASQVTSSDKLSRLQTELAFPLEIAKLILQRETCKKECAQQSQNVWEKRLAFVDLKRKFPAMSDKTDEELLVDKERPAKRPESSRVPGLKIRTHDTNLPIVRPEIIIKPRERIALIQEQIEVMVNKQKERDHHWEDQLESPYQAQPVPLASRYFKYIPPSETLRTPAASDTTSDGDDEPRPVAPRAARRRIGRGGRQFIDVRQSSSRRTPPRAARSSLFSAAESSMDVDDGLEEQDRLKRLEERWRFDIDDAPAAGPFGSDEQDRVLIDDFDPKYLRHAMTLFSDQDHHNLSTDPSLLLPTADGRQQMVVPYRLGLQPIVRRDQQGHVRAWPHVMGMGGMTPGVPPNNAALINASGTPVSMQHQIKKMPPPNGIPQMRISSNGGMRPPSLPTTVAQPNGIMNHQSPPHPLPLPVVQHTSPNGVNGVSRAAISMPHIDIVKPTDALPNGTSGVAAQHMELTAETSEVTVNGNASVPKAQNQVHLGLGVPTNGYHLTPLTPAAAAALATTNGFNQMVNPQRPTSLSLQKVQEIKSAFANFPPDLANLQSNNGRALAANFLHANGNNVNMQIPAGTNMNLKLPAARQMQWALGAGMQRPPSAVNGIDGQSINGTGASSPSPTHIIPVRSPSANGVRPGVRVGPNGQLQMSPHLQHTPSPMPSISHSQSPPRLPMTPTMAMGSPSMQHQQPVGSTQNGY